MHGTMTFVWGVAVVFLVFALGVGLGGSWDDAFGLLSIPFVLTIFALGFHSGIADRNAEIAKRR